MKKYLAYVLMLVLLLGLTTPLKVNAAGTKVTEHVTRIGDVVNSTLWDGVTVERMHIQSARAGSYNPSDSGLTYDWDSISVVALNNPAIKIASWGLTTTSGYKQGTTAVIAKDYELKHKGYTVLAAVNGDFFANASYTTSAGVSMQPTFEPINGCRWWSNIKEGCYCSPSSPSIRYSPRPKLYIPYW